MSDLDDLGILAAMPPLDCHTALGATCVGGRGLTPIERVKIARVVAACRAKLGAEMVDISLATSHSSMVVCNQTQTNSNVNEVELGLSAMVAAPASVALQTTSTSAGRLTFSDCVGDFLFSREWADIVDGLHKVKAAFKKWGAEFDMPVRGFYNRRLVGDIIECSAQCDGRDECSRRYKLIASPGQGGQVWAHGTCNPLRPAIVRMANVPLLKRQRSAISQELGDPRHARRKRPREVQEDLTGTPNQFAPGDTIANLKKKLVLRSKSGVDVIGMEVWLEERKVHISPNDEIAPWPSDTSDPVVTTYTVTANVFQAVYTALRFAGYVAELATNATSVVGQE